MSDNDVDLNELRRNLENAGLGDEAKELLEALDTYERELYKTELDEINKELEETWLNRYYNNEPIASMPPFMSDFYQPSVVDKISEKRKAKFEEIKERISKLTDQIINNKPSMVLSRKEREAKEAEEKEKEAKRIEKEKEAKRITEEEAKRITEEEEAKRIAEEEEEEEEARRIEKSKIAKGPEGEKKEGDPSILELKHEFNRHIDFYGLVYDPKNVYTHFQFYHNDPDTLIIYNENFRQFKDKTDISGGGGNGIYRQVRTDTEEDITRNKDKLTTEVNKIVYKHPVLSPCFGIPTGPHKTEDNKSGDEPLKEDLDSIVINPDMINILKQSIYQIIIHVNKNNNIKRILYACSDDGKLGLSIFKKYKVSWRIVNVLWDEFFNIYKPTIIRTGSKTYIDQFFIRFENLEKFEFDKLPDYDVNILNEYDYAYSCNFINDLNKIRTKFFERDNIFLKAFRTNHNLYDKWIENNNKIIENLCEVINYWATPNKYYLLNICLYIAFLNVTSNFNQVFFDELHGIFYKHINGFYHDLFPHFAIILLALNIIYSFIYEFLSQYGRYIDKINTDDPNILTYIHHILRLSALNQLMNETKKIYFPSNALTIDINNIIISRNIALMYDLMKFVYGANINISSPTYTHDKQNIHVILCDMTMMEKDKDTGIFSILNVPISGTRDYISHVLKFASTFELKKHNDNEPSYMKKHIYSDEHTKYKLYESDGSTFNDDYNKLSIVKDVNIPYIKTSNELEDVIFHQKTINDKYAFIDLLYIEHSVNSNIARYKNMKDLYKASIPAIKGTLMYMTYLENINQIKIAVYEQKIVKYCNLIVLYSYMYNILYKYKVNYKYNIHNKIIFISSILNDIVAYYSDKDYNTFVKKYILHDNYSFDKMYNHITKLYDYLTTIIDKNITGIVPFEYGLSEDIAAKILTIVDVSAIADRFGPGPDDDEDEVPNINALFGFTDDLTGDLSGGSRKKPLTKSSRESKYKEKQLQLLRKMFR